MAEEVKEEKKKSKSTGIVFDVDSDVNHYNLFEPKAKRTYEILRQNVYQSQSMNPRTVVATFQQINVGRLTVDGVRKYIIEYLNKNLAETLKIALNQLGEQGFKTVINIMHSKTTEDGQIVDVEVAVMY